MTVSNLVIVESPAKAKTIGKYLGSNYQVLASFGHIRDIPSKNNMVDTNNNFEISWQTSENKKKYLNDIFKHINPSTKILLATDPDREGEAIAWHIVKEIEKKFKHEVDYQRIVFYEVTKDAILTAINQPRDIDNNLLQAYIARRALDYLVGFTLSPILWRKLPSAKSAGRVQSVALKLITERETEIESFVPSEYWLIQAQVYKKEQEKKNFIVRLVEYDKKKVEKFSYKNADQANKIKSELDQYDDLVVENIETKKTHRSPTAPFTTSTLQQEANRKLGFSASKTMLLAQKLYEGLDIGKSDGTQALITYMRTDSTTISNQALTDIRSEIVDSFTTKYLASEIRVFKKKQKNAQEAHEAIRPINIKLNPKQLQNKIDQDCLSLYQLIWNKTISSQMTDAVYDASKIVLKTEDNKARFRITGRSIVFDGFLKVYLDDEDESSDSYKPDLEDALIPSLAENEKISINEIQASQHFTKAKPRFTEASLVRNLEALGIGRPSTYANILKLLKDRNYVSLRAKSFIANPSGRILTAFLQEYFQKYLEYNFTAEMEETLDGISNGKSELVEVLQKFWTEFSNIADKTKDLRVAEVIDLIDSVMEPVFFGYNKYELKKNRLCPDCGSKLGLKFSKFGPFIGCEKYPDCKYTRNIASKTINTSISDRSDNNSDSKQDSAQKVISADQHNSHQIKDAANNSYQSSNSNNSADGSDDDKNIQYPIVIGEIDGMEVSVRLGPFGVYLQKETNNTKKPKRTKLPSEYDPKTVTLEQAKKLLSLPREVGRDPETKKPILANTGRFGPYVQIDNIFASIPKGENPYDIGLNRAIVLISERKLKLAEKKNKYFKKGKK